jgi:hypothetical protein
MAITSFASAQGNPAPAPGTPGAPGHDPTARTHDGFFLRFHIGPAGFAASATDGVDEVTVSGSGGGFGLALGAAVKPRVIVYLEVFDDIAIGPTLEVNGQSATASDDVRAGVIGIGPGIAYYFPSNVYVSATFAVAKLTIQEDGEEVAESDTGFGVSAALGKEWWVSSQWGLGVAGQMFLGTIPDGDAEWSTAGVMLAFSATYN